MDKSADNCRRGKFNFLCPDYVIVLLIVAVVITWFFVCYFFFITKLLCILNEHGLRRFPKSPTKLTEESPGTNSGRCLQQKLPSGN